MHFGAILALQPLLGMAGSAGSSFGRKKVRLESRPLFLSAVVEQGRPQEFNPNPASQFFYVDFS